MMTFFPARLSHALIVGVLLLSACCATSVNNGLYKIPLERIESGLERLFRQGADLSLVEGLYDMNKNKAQASRLVMEKGQLIPTHDTLNLFKYFETQYAATINIGNPGRAFKMVLDTTWAYSWVPSNDCPKYSMPCALHQKYDHSQSSSYAKDGRAFNISKELSGYMSTDVFHVGNYNATHQGFAELTKIPFIFALHNTDGSIGFGLKDLSPMALPFFDNLAEQNQMQKIFSCCIDRYHLSLMYESPTPFHTCDITNARPFMWVLSAPSPPFYGSNSNLDWRPHGHSKKGAESYFLLGGIDYSLNSSVFTSVDLTSPFFWQFNMTKVSVVQDKVRKLFCVNGCSALADTSTNTIVGPADEVKAINNLVGATRMLFSNRYWVSCKTILSGPNVTFTIANKEFHIEPKDYIEKLEYMGVPICITAFQPADTKDFPENTWSLGGAFLYRYYTAFDIDNRQFMIADI